MTTIKEGNYQYTAIFTDQGGLSTEAYGQLGVEPKPVTQIVDGNPSLAPNEPASTSQRQETADNGWNQWLMRFGLGVLGTVVLSGILNESRKKCTDDNNELANAVSKELGLGFNFGYLPDYEHGAKAFKELIDGIEGSYPAIYATVTTSKQGITLFAKHLAEFVRANNMLQSRNFCLSLTSCFTKRRTLNANLLANKMHDFLAANYPNELPVESPRNTSAFTRGSTGFFVPGSSKTAGIAAAISQIEGYQQGEVTTEGLAGYPGNTSNTTPTTASDSLPNSIELVTTSSGSINDSHEELPPPPPLPTAF